MGACCLMQRLGWDATRRNADSILTLEGDCDEAAVGKGCLTLWEAVAVLQGDAKCSVSLSRRSLLWSSSPAGCLMTSVYPLPSKNDE